MIREIGNIIPRYPPISNVTCELRPRNQINIETDIIKALFLIMCHDNWILIFKILLADNNAKAGPQLCKYIPPQGASP